MSNADFKPKWIKWDEDAFRADTIVRRMNNTQRAFYRCLLMECYMGPFRPYLPDDDEELWMLAEAENIAHWQEHKALILKKFSKVTSSDGAKLLQNKRVMEEWEDLAKMLAAKSRAGSASVAARRAHAKPTSAHAQQPLLPAAPAEQMPAAAPEQTRTESEEKENRGEQNRIVCSTPANKCSTGVESSKPTPSSSDSKAKPGGQVSKFVKRALVVAKKTNDRAVFSKNGTKELYEAIELIDPDRAKLEAYVVKEVGKMGEWDLARCDAVLAANMDAAMTAQAEEESQRAHNAAQIAEITAKAQQKLEQERIERAERNKQNSESVDATLAMLSGAPTKAVSPLADFTEKELANITGD